MVCADAVNEIPLHVPHLLAQARRFCRNEADARDLVQDTCLNAVEALNRMEHAPDNVRGWLVVIMRNHWFSRVRKYRVRENAHTQLRQEESFDAGHELRVLCSRLVGAWSRLSPQSRNIASQCLLEGDSQEQVSRRLGMTAGGIAASLHRTRRVLRLEMFGAES